MMRSDFSSEIMVKRKIKLRMRLCIVISIKEFYKSRCGGPQICNMPFETNLHYL